MFPITTKFSVYVFDTLAQANASGILFGYGKIMVIKGDNTRFKIGGGNTISFDTPAVVNAQTFANTPWVNTAAATSETPFTTFAQNATGTITAANLLKKYITSTSAAAVTLTLPTATLLGAALGAARGTEFDFTVDNSAGANIVTVAVGAGIVAGTAVITGSDTLTVAAGAIGKFKIIFKTATTAVLFRVL